jgi:hypothetical protein
MLEKGKSGFVDVAECNKIMRRTYSKEARYQASKTGRRLTGDAPR